MSFRLRPEAENDILSIALYISDFNPDAALKWQHDILHDCRLLAQNPGIGVFRNSIRPGLRIFPRGRYLILYQQTDFGIDVVRVVHGARLWQNLH